MSAFEFQLSLFTLLLGFILVEVLSGLMRTLRARLPSGPGVRAEIRIGWLTPMLGAYTMLNVLLWWGNVWGLQHIIPIGFDSTTIGLLLCSFFYFAASMIFPAEPRDWPDVDDWFWLHRRQVLGGILAANSPLLLSFFFVGNPSASEQAVNAVVTGLQVAMILLAIIPRKRWIVTTALAALIVIHLSFIPLEILHRNGIW